MKWLFPQSSQFLHVSHTDTVILVLNEIFPGFEGVFQFYSILALYTNSGTFFSYIFFSPVQLLSHKMAVMFFLFDCFVLCIHNQTENDLSGRIMNLPFLSQPLGGLCF